MPVEPAWENAALYELAAAVLLMAFDITIPPGNASEGTNSSAGEAGFLSAHAIRLDIRTMLSP